MVVKDVHKTRSLPVVNSEPQRQSRHSRIQAESKFNVACSAQKFYKNKKTNRTCVMQRKVSITVLAIGAILLNLKRFVIYVSCDQVLLTPTYQVSLCYIPCIAVSCKTGFSNISIREERKTYEWRIYVWQIQQKYLVFLLLVFAVKLLPVLLHSSWELLTSRCMQWMQIEAMNTNPWENYKMLTTADPSFPFPYLYFQLGAHCFW